MTWFQAFVFVSVAFGANLVGYVHGYVVGEREGARRSLAPDPPAVCPVCGFVADLGTYCGGTSVDRHPRTRMIG